MSIYEHTKNNIFVHSIQSLIESNSFLLNEIYHQGSSWTSLDIQDFFYALYNPVFLKPITLLKNVNNPNIEVLDGKQRILHIHEFMKGNLAIFVNKNGKVVPSHFVESNPDDIEALVWDNLNDCDKVSFSIFTIPAISLNHKNCDRSLTTIEKLEYVLMTHSNQKSSEDRKNSIIALLKSEKNKV